MTAPEVVLLVVGLVVGTAVGMILASLRQARPRVTGEVRVTVTTDAIPRRSATLAHDGTALAVPPARGGPADAAAPAAQPPATLPDRTSVRAIAAPVAAASPGGAGQATPARMVAVPVGAGVDPLLEILRGSGRRTGTAVLDRTAASHPAPSASAEDAPDAGSSAPATSASAVAESAAGPCAELRVAADERCEVATRARQGAERAQETLRAAQRSYEDHLSQAGAAAEAADPRAIRAAKDAAQEAFRTARAQAGTREDVDAAARDWLVEVNRINGAARSATADASRAQEAARALAGSLDRLAVEADAARIAAEAADEACLGARQAVADCEEASAPPPAGTMPRMHSGAPVDPWFDEGPAEGHDSSALRAGTAPTIFRLLQGDPDTMAAVVERIAGDDPEQRRQWQLAISDLLDAILATAIEGAALEFPEDHPFWGLFTVTQARDIVGALGSLGYRFDGMGGWQDGRIPSQRDLSLALGYAGEDPMRVRHWPTEAEIGTLFQPVRVAAGEYLAVAAGDLTLGELVAMLGKRADGLTEVWNAWGRIRPILLEER